MTSLPPTPDATRRAHSFNAAAAQYAAHRPSYPPALFDAVEQAAGRPLTGARVVDVGAGTGISAGRLVDRGARVVAVEPGAGMAAEFRRALPGVPLVRGDGNHLPLTTACADFVTYAQAWHWTDPQRSVPEALRVLRPGGTLALWWNVPDLSVTWQADQHARVQDYFGTGTGAHGTADWVRALSKGLGVSFVDRQVHWSRRVDVDGHLANLGSHSLFLVHDETDAAAFLAAERTRLLETFPGGEFDEHYVVDLVTTTRPR